MDTSLIGNRYFLVILLIITYSFNVNAADFEEFKNSLYKDFTGAYIVEGDIPIRNDEALYEYYLDITNGTNSGNTGDLIVSNLNGVDQIWNSSMRKSLTYCVSNAFAQNYDLVVNEMNEASAAWEANALNVDFIHLQNEDTNCTNNNNNVVFNVIPAPNSGGLLARAFFPFEPRQDREVLITDNGLSSQAIDLVAILRHELGHVLGYRHEHTRPEAGAPNCLENNNWRVVTNYDSNSVMHYPQCNGTGGWALDLTDFDIQGTRNLYGIHEDFEESLSLYNSSRYLWSRDSNGTPSSGTGPVGGADGSIYYGYVETSSGYAYNNGNTSILETEGFEIEHAMLTFDYHMFGSNIGSLNVDVFKNGDWINSIWSKSGQQHSSNSDNWSKATISLSSYSGEIKVRFRAVAAGGYRGDIAIDNVLIEKASIGCNSNEAPIGTILETIYDENGKLERYVEVANAFDIQPGRQGDIDVIYSFPAGCPFSWGCDGVREKEYNACSLDGRLGYVEDEGDGDFLPYPTCWQRTLGFIECP